MRIIKTLFFVISLFVASHVDAESWIQMDSFHQNINNKSSFGYYFVDEDSISKEDDAEVIRIKYVYSISPYPNVYNELVSKVQFKCDAHKFREVENIRYKDEKIVRSISPLKFLNRYKDIFTGSVNDKVLPIACGQTTIAQLQQEKDKNLKGSDAQQTSSEHSESGGGWEPEQNVTTNATTEKVTAEYKYSNGNRYVGILENGLPHGKGVITAPNGNRYEGTVSQGQIVGYGIFYYTNGNRYEGDVSNGVQNGNGTFYYNGGGAIVGVFENGQPSNTAILTDKNGNYFHGQYKQFSPYNGDIYNASNQSIGKVINGKITSSQQNQSTSGEGLSLGKIFGAIVEGAAAYQEGKNSVRNSQYPVVNVPQSAAVYHEGNSPLPVRPLAPLILPPLPSPPPIYIPSKEPITGKISGD
jgi:hypothetical protein